MRSPRPPLIAAAALAVAGAFVPVSAAASHAPAARPVPAVAGHVMLNTVLAAPPTTADCEAQVGIACYSPLQYRQAYDTKPLFDRGITGKGRTIAIVDSFGSPTIANDLHVFDQAYGMPDPPSLRVIQPAGAVPPFDPNDGTMVGWAAETTLDVEYAHAIAPDANILLVETPVAETEGVTGFPEMIRAENFVIDHHLADVISQSFGATEQTFPNRQSLFALRSAFINAAVHGVTVLAASGDDGATDAMSDGSTLFPFPVNSWPSADPLVTSIGGTQLHLDAAGNRTAPDQVWNDGFGAGGGGKSIFFPRPDFQDRVRSVVGNQRGTPDISMTAAVDGAAIFYFSFLPGRVGFHLVGGTSEACPIFAGVVALADQFAHHSLGDLNPALYDLARHGGRGIVDVTIGDNSFAGVTGFPATPGYDLASGWGTVDIGRFVPAIAGAARY
jgi:subtilase family serine protease